VGPSLDEWNPKLLRWPSGSCAYGESRCRRGADPEAMRSKWALLHLVASHNVTLQGPGVLQANGASFWRVRNSRPEVRGYCLLKIQDSTGIVVRNLQLTDSPMYHAVVAQSRQVRLEGLTISVGDELALHGNYAHNTDGLSIGPASSDVQILDCDVASGDDNLVIKAGSQHISVAGLILRRGKGISIGSLGERNSDGTVRDCSFQNVTLFRSMHGARIKTWRGGRGEVRNITFRNFHVYEVDFGMLVDQMYCPPSQRPEGCENEQGDIKISAVRFERFRGTFRRAAKSVVCGSRCDLTYTDLKLSPMTPIAFRR